MNAHPKTTGCQPSKPWDQQPPAAQERATNRKEALRVYFETRKGGDTDKAATAKAIRTWSSLTGKPVSDRQFRNWAKKIKTAGGHERAPMEAYLDNKSCDHSAERARRAEALTSSEWAKLLSISPQAVQKRKLPATKVSVLGGFAKAIKYADLPADWQARAKALRKEQGCRQYRDLLAPKPSVPRLVDDDSTGLKGFVLRFDGAIEALGAIAPSCVQALKTAGYDAIAGAARLAK